MVTSNNPFSPEEVQKFKEISARAEFHHDEYQRLTRELDQYRDCCRQGNVASTYRAEELEAFEALSGKAKLHYEELQVCQLQMKPYRDLKNVIDYARQEGYRKGYVKGVALRCLEENLPIAKIAQITGLNEAEVEALRALQD